WTCCALCLCLAAPTLAQPPFPEPIKMTVRPTAAPSPALRYRLLPEVRELSPGNAAVLYSRALSFDWSRSYRQPLVAEQIQKGQENPRQPPDARLRWVLDLRTLQEFDRAARRQYCDWELTERLRQEGIELQVPELHALREYAQ